MRTVHGVYAIRSFYLCVCLSVKNITLLESNGRMSMKFFLRGQFLGKQKTILTVGSDVDHKTDSGFELIRIIGLPDHAGGLHCLWRYFTLHIVSVSTYM